MTPLSPPDNASAESVQDVEHYTERLFRFRLTRPQSFRFRSGEFVMLALPAEKPIWRAYSIASPAWDETLSLAERAQFAELLTGDAREFLANRDSDSATIVSWSVVRPFEAGDTRPRIAVLQLHTMYGDEGLHRETFTLCERGDALGFLSFEISEATAAAR